MINWAKQTTTSTASPFTLSDATGFVPLDESPLSANAHVVFTIFDSTNEEYATGYGTVTANTLTVIEYRSFWNGTAYDDTSPSPSWSAGSKDVYLGPTVDIPGFAMPRGFTGGDSGDGIGLFGHPGSNSDTQAMTSDDILAMPGFWVGGFPIDSYNVYTTSASSPAGSSMRAGWYAAHTDGTPGKLLLDMGELDTSVAAGPLSQSFTQTFVPPGWYWVVMCFEENVTLQSYENFAHFGLVHSGATGGRSVVTLRDNTFTYPASMPADLSVASGLTWAESATPGPTIWFEEA